MNGPNQMYGLGQQQFGQQTQGRSGPTDGQPVDYEAEFNKLGKGGAFLKFDDNVGIEVVIASEGMQKEDAFDDPKTGERKLIMKMSFQVYAKDAKGVYDGKTLITWDIPVGISEKSLFGKVIYLIKKTNNGKATGLRLRVAKDTSGKKPEYKVVEYDQLKNKEMFESNGQAQSAPQMAQPAAAQPMQPMQVPQQTAPRLPPEAFA